MAGWHADGPARGALELGSADDSRGGADESKGRYDEAAAHSSRPVTAS
jgi:hypothetical protein